MDAARCYDVKEALAGTDCLEPVRLTRTPLLYFVHTLLGEHVLS